MPHREPEKNRLDDKIANIEPSTLETMDTAIYNYINEELNPFCTTNKGWSKVPIIWATAERAKQTKDRLDSREESAGTLIFPIVTVERTSVTKDPARKGGFWANIPSPRGFGQGGVATVARRINQDKTGNHQNAYRKRDRNQLNFKISKRDNRVIYRYERMPQPIYLDVEYQLKIRTEYQQQMNEIAEVFMRIGEGINHDTVKHAGYKYEIFVDSGFSQENNISNMAEEERKYETTVNIKMLGKLIGLGDNQEFPQVQYVENAIEYKLPKEEVIWADPFLGKGKVNPWDE